MYICHNAYIGVVLGVNVSIYGSPISRGRTWCGSVGQQSDDSACQNDGWVHVSWECRSVPPNLEVGLDPDTVGLETEAPRLGLGWGDCVGGRSTNIFRCNFCVSWDQKWAHEWIRLPSVKSSNRAPGGANQSRYSWILDDFG